MRWGIGFLTLALALGVGVPKAPAGEWQGGIGVIGDSYSDEYQFYPPNRSRARNWIEILAATRRLDFGPFSLEDRGTPRQQGYAYNWAQSWATTDDMIREGQHLGLAAQVARGDVRLVWIFIGGNDFINAMYGPDPPATLPGISRRAAANLQGAVATILAASPEVKVILGTVPDIRDLPEFADQLKAGSIPASWLDAATDALRQYNLAIRDLAGRESRIGLADLDLITRVARLVPSDYLVLGGRQVARRGSGDDLNHVFLSDRRHIGTIAQGLLARAFLTATNAHCGTDIPLPSDREIVDFASEIEHSSPTLAGSPASGSSSTP